MALLLLFLEWDSCQDESIAGKIAEQISRIVFDAPHSLRMEKEFEPLQRAALEVFREMYPNREHFLKKR